MSDNLDFRDAWNSANYNKKHSNLARCYIEAVKMARGRHKPNCICVLCEVFADERSQSDATGDPK
jgi:hypothetical protein